MTARRQTALDAARIVEVLAAHEVEYVMIGGLAVQAHGHLPTTQDADILPAPDADNLGRLLRALRELGARPLDHSLASSAPLDAATCRPTIRSPWRATPAGSTCTERRLERGQLRDRALVVEVFGVEVRFADRDDLIAMKRAARRPLDMGDIAALTSSER